MLTYADVSHHLKLAASAAAVVAAVVIVMPLAAF
jgi:hypothetical protein